MNITGLSGRSFYLVLSLVLLAALFLSAIPRWKQPFRDTLPKSASPAKYRVSQTSCSNDISGTKGWNNAVNLIGLRGGPDPAALIPKYYGPAGKPAGQISTIHPADALQAMKDAISATTFEGKQKATYIV
jgi:hypothetical protein